MSKQQLYINGKAVDMPSEEIKIKVESNLFSDADKIMTAHSYTFTLPRTMTNDSVFMHAYTPTVITGGNTTHTYLKASLHVDGLPLFDDGQAVLTKVDEKGYNLNLAWGLIGVFDIIKEEGLKLYELPLSQYWDESTMATWTQLAKNDALPYASGMDDAIYNTLDSDSKAQVDKLPYKLQWFDLIGNTASSILRKIQQVYGMTIELSHWAQKALKYLVYVPTSLNNMVGDEQFNLHLQATLLRRGSDYTYTWMPVATYSNQQFYDNLVNKVSEPMENIYYSKNTCVAKEIVIRGTASANFYVVSPTNETIYATYQGGQYVINQTWYDVEIKEGYRFATVASASSYVTSSDTISVVAHITLAGAGDVKRGDWWCWERNYPNMTVMDFLSELMAHCNGVIVGSVTKPDHIKILQLDEVAEATPQTLDVQGVSSVEMTMNDLAQKNEYKHTENDDTTPSYEASGVTYTHDTTIKHQRDAFKSGFKVSRSSLVKLFEVEKNENNSNYKARWAGRGDYLMVYNTDEYVGSQPSVNGYGASFDLIIDRYYQNFERMTRRPKVIEATARMTVLDVLRFDMARPVHITQLASNYLCLSLEGQGNDMYKLRLIQL